MLSSDRGSGFFTKLDQNHQKKASFTGQILDREISKNNSRQKSREKK